MNIKKAIWLFTPPILLKLAKRIWKKRSSDVYSLSEEYRNWDEALSNSTGYDSQIILEKTKNALLKVKNNDAVYERDTVLFENIEYSWPLLSGLMWVAAQNNGVLNVLDFGGSLGSSFFQNRDFLRGLSSVQWNIVEQPEHVFVGREYFQDETLKFFDSIDEVLSITKPNVALFSGVLQYTRNPFEILASIQNENTISIIIDRTPFWKGNYDKVYVQLIDPSLYKSSYPMWVFSLQKFREFIGENRSATEFVCFENGLFGLLWKGIIIGGQPC